MMIVASISSTEEANEIAFISKSFVVANRARQLAHEQHKGIRKPRGESR